MFSSKLARKFRLTFHLPPMDLRNQKNKKETWRPFNCGRALAITRTSVADKQQWHGAGIQPAMSTSFTDEGLNTQLAKAPYLKQERMAEEGVINWTGKEPSPSPSAQLIQALFFLIKSIFF